MLALGRRWRGRGRRATESSAKAVAAPPTGTPAGTDAEVYAEGAATGRFEDDTSDGSPDPNPGYAWRRDTPEITGALEVVIALVAPVGSPTSKVCAVLTKEFESHGYRPESIELSGLIDNALLTPPEDAAADRWTRLMNKGDLLRERYDDQAVAALMAASAINLSRSRQVGDDRNRSLHVSIVRSLKREEEVRVLRQIYGERLVVIGISTPEEQRRKSLIKNLERDFKPAEAKALAARLIHRDENDEFTTSGQRVRDAFEQCDAYLSGRPTDIVRDVGRIVEVLLGEPWSTPLSHEQAMFHAYAAMFRSSAAGRQVGAAIVDDLGEVVTLGCNDVPRPHGGQFWPGDARDRRDFRLSTDANDAGKFDAVRELLTELANSGWLVGDYKDLNDDDRAEAALTKSGPLSSTRVRNLIEFGRIMHAEMAALMTSAREGRSVRGCSLYTTTYPCHECMRLIIGAGISKVVYIDPYPKSMAEELYDEMLGVTPSRDHVEVVPYTGVAPRLFPRVFELNNRGKDLRGVYRDWTDKSLRTTNPEFSSSMVYQEEAAIQYLFRKRGQRPTDSR